MQPQAPLPHVVVVPAMGVHSAYYRTLESALGAIGWSACTMAARGIDRDTPAPSRDLDWGYAEVIAGIADHVATVRAQQPETPIVLLGHSLGGQVSLGYLLDGGAVDGLVLAGASEPWCWHYGARSWGIWGLAVSVPLLTTLYGYWPRWGFGGPQPRTLMREWARFVRRRRLPHPRGPVPTRALDVPTFVLQVEGDQLSVPRAARALSRAVRPDRLTWWDYRRAEAPEGARIDHLSWAKAPAPAVEALQDWWAVEGARVTTP